jgi:hypothetical protein
MHYSRQFVGGSCLNQDGRDLWIFGISRRLNQDLFDWLMAGSAVPLAVIWRKRPAYA